MPLARAGHCGKPHRSVARPVAFRIPASLTTSRISRTLVSRLMSQRRTNPAAFRTSAESGRCEISHVSIPMPKSFKSRSAEILDVTRISAAEACTLHVTTKTDHAACSPRRRFLDFVQNQRKGRSREKESTQHTGTESKSKCFVHFTSPTGLGCECLVSGVPW